MILNPVRTGVAFGSLIGLWHLAWAALVAVGWAQPLLDFILWIHFVQMSVTVGPFDPGRALLLVVVTFVVGFVAATLFAVIWNRLHRPVAA